MRRKINSLREATETENTGHGQAPSKGQRESPLPHDHAEWKSVAALNSTLRKDTVRTRTQLSRAVSSALTSRFWL